MTLQREENPTKQALNLIFFDIPHDVLLQISTGPALIGLLGAKACSEALQAVSQASEEVLRGDRLPVLPFPEVSKSEIN